MSTKKNDNYIDGWAGLDKAIAAKSKVEASQCSNCSNKVGTHACKVFGERPHEYASPLVKSVCPERKVK